MSDITIGLVAIFIVGFMLGRWFAEREHEEEDKDVKECVKNLTNVLKEIEEKQDEKEI